MLHVISSFPKSKVMVFGKKSTTIDDFLFGDESIMRTECHKYFGTILALVKIFSEKIIPT